MTLKLEGASHARIVQLSLELPAGLCVILGSPSDGSIDLLELCAGEVAPTRGHVHIDDETPHRSPRLRRALGTAYSDAPLEEKLVRDAVARRLAIHECSVTPESALGRFGTERLLARTSASLTATERHALQLVIALSLDQPKALLFCEPLAFGGDLDTGVVLDAIRQRAEAGVVVCATASPRVAALLSPEALLLENGRIKRKILVPTRPAFTPGARACIRIECTHADLMAEALTRHQAVSGLRWQRGDAFLVAEGPEAEALSNAILSLSVERQWWISQLTQELPNPVEIRASQAALARAAYETTHHRAHAGSGENA